MRVAMSEGQAHGREGVGEEVTLRKNADVERVAKELRAYICQPQSCWKPILTRFMKSTSATLTGQPESSLHVNSVLSPLGCMNTPSRDIYSLIFPWEKKINKQKMKEGAGETNQPSTVLILCDFRWSKESRCLPSHWPKMSLKFQNSRFLCFMRRL